MLFHAPCAHGVLTYMLNLTQGSTLPRHPYCEDLLWQVPGVQLDLNTFFFPMSWAMRKVYPNHKNESVI